MFDTIYEDLTSSEKDQFERICRKLLKSTFIVRDKDNESKNSYYFASKNYNLINNYFSYIGFNIYLDQSSGVVMLQNKNDHSNGIRNQLNRVSLKKYESILLCCLWMIYLNHMSSSKLGNMIISFTELNLELEKYKVKDAFDRTSIENALNLFKRYNLLDINGKIGNPDCAIKLYPSLQFALDHDSFKDFVENANKRMKVKNKDMNEEEEEEEDDE